MASVMFISETGFPHSAFRVDGSRWYGFKPNIPKRPIAPGHVDHSDRFAFILHEVTFHLVEDRIQPALSRILAAYGGAWYFGGVKDCVTFTADFAEALGLRIPWRPNFSPDHFVKALGRLNGSVGRSHPHRHL